MPTVPRAEQPFQRGPNHRRVTLAEYQQAFACFTSQQRAHTLQQLRAFSMTELSSSTVLTLFHEQGSEQVQVELGTRMLARHLVDLLDPPPPPPRTWPRMAWGPYSQQVLNLPPGVRASLVEYLINLPLTESGRSIICPNPNGEGQVEVELPLGQTSFDQLLDVLLAEEWPKPAPPRPPTLPPGY